MKENRIDLLTYAGLTGAVLLLALFIVLAI